MKGVERTRISVGTGCGNIFLCQKTPEKFCPQQTAGEVAQQNVGKDGSHEAASLLSNQNITCGEREYGRMDCQAETRYSRIRQYLIGFFAFARTCPGQAGEGGIRRFGAGRQSGQRRKRLFPEFSSIICNIRLSDKKQILPDCRKNNRNRCFVAFHKKFTVSFTAAPPAPARAGSWRRWAFSNPPGG